MKTPKTKYPKPTKVVKIKTDGVEAKNILSKISNEEKEILELLEKDNLNLEYIEEFFGDSEKELMKLMTIGLVEMKNYGESNYYDSINFFGLTPKGLLEINKKDDKSIIKNLNVAKNIICVDGLLNEELKEFKRDVNVDKDFTSFIFESHKEDLKDYSDSIKRFFSNSNIESIKLYRGISEQGKVYGLNSWTRDPKIAEIFSDGVVVESNIPTEYILDYYEFPSSISHYEECEVIVDLPKKFKKVKRVD